jgi:hypothetical protein
MHSEPQPEHRWLEQLVGEWTFETECVMEPGKPAEKSVGSDIVRSLGGLWVLCEGRFDMPSGPGITMMTLGFDPAKKRFVGTFIGSMMTHMWIYDGQLAGQVLTLDAEGPSFTAPDKMAKYQDIIEIVSADHRVLRSQFRGDDGAWHPFMTAHYRRK